MSVSLGTIQRSLTSLGCVSIAVGLVLAVWGGFICAEISVGPPPTGNTHLANPAALPLFPTCYSIVWDHFLVCIMGGLSLLALQGFLPTVHPAPDPTRPQTHSPAIKPAPPKNGSVTSNSVQINISNLTVDGDFGLEIGSTGPPAGNANANRKKRASRKRPPGPNSTNQQKQGTTTAALGSPIETSMGLGPSGLP